MAIEVRIARGVAVKTMKSERSKRNMMILNATLLLNKWLHAYDQAVNTYACRMLHAH